MAKLSGLIPVVAGVLNVPEKTVAIHARHLRQARRISTGGRGLGGADMIARDCANLLIAIMGSDYAKDAAETVTTYRSIETITTWTRWQLPYLHLPALKSLPEGHRFGEALDALIESAKEGSLEVALMGANMYLREARFSIGASLNVTVKGPIPVARISIDASEWGEELTYAPPDPWTKTNTPPEIEVAKWKKKKIETEDPPGNLEQIRRISARTILTLGHFLNDAPNRSSKDDDSATT